ncbi:MAG: 30S ribosomal protein S18 [Dehalococcoidia bacterium]
MSSNSTSREGGGRDHQSSDGQNRQSSGPRREGGGGRRFYNRRKVCFFCANKDVTMDYKNPEGLSRYISDRARIEPRRKTGTCSKHQRLLTKHIKRARHLGLLPYTTDSLKEISNRRS